MAVNRLNDNGIGSTVTSPSLKAQMFKVYIRSTLHYGLENLRLNKTETKKINRTDSALLKKLLKVSKHCYTTELKLSLSIEHTFVRLRAQKLNFFDRLQENQFTKTLNEELDRMKIKNSFPDEIKELLKLVEDADPYSDSLSHKTKIKLLIEAWTIHEKSTN